MVKRIIKDIQKQLIWVSREIIVQAESNPATFRDALATASIYKN